jgi:glutaredoxin-related protein
MYLDTVSTPFAEGIDSFVKATKAYVANNVRSKGYIHCPCVDCKNEKAYRILDVKKIL